MTTLSSLVQKLVLVAALAVSACSTTVGYQDPALRSAALSAFRTGDARLSCPQGTTCLFAWAATRPAAARLLQAQRWEDLADVVMAANYDVDLAWFYLGVAASGMGYNDVARTYLDRSIQRSIIGGTQACAPLTCDGINLPDQANSFMANLPVTPPPTPPRRRAASIRRPVTKSASPPAGPAPGASSPVWVAPVPDSQ